MRSLSSSLIAAGQALHQEPICKVEVVNHPYMLGSPLQYAEFATPPTSTPVDGVVLDNGNIFLVHASSGHKTITTPEGATEWESAWTAYSPALPADTEVVAVATSGANIQVFAQRIAEYDWSVYLLTSGDYGSTWDPSWLDIGAPLELPSWHGAHAEYNALFFKTYTSASGILLSAFIYEFSWQYSYFYTGLVQPTPSTNAELGAVRHRDNSYTVYFTAINPATLDDNAGIFSVEFTDMVWGQPVAQSFYMAQEFSRTDIIRSVSTVGDRKVMVVKSERGSFETIEPLIEVTDDFTGYGGIWRRIANFNTLESWSMGNGGSWDTTNYVEGGRGLKITCTTTSSTDFYSTYTLDNPVDLDNEGRFENDDYLCLAFYVDNATNFAYMSIVLGTSEVDGWYVAEVYQAEGVVTGWNYWKIRKDYFSGTGSAPDWANITFVRVHPVAGIAPLNVTFDYMRLEKADPDGSGNPNPTGSVWNTQPAGSEWAITTSSPYTAYLTRLACFDREASVEKCAVYTKASLTRFFTMSCLIGMEANSECGVIFLSSDITEGSEDCYALLLSSTSQTITLYKYVGGTRTSLGSASLANYGGYWYIGVSVIGERIQCYASAAEETLFDTVKVEVDDLTFSAGNFGMMSIGSSSTMVELSVKGYDDTGFNINNTLVFMSDNYIGDAIIFDSNPPPDKLIGSRYGYNISENGGVIYRANRAIDGEDFTVSDDITSVNASYPRESSSSLGVNLRNDAGKYADHQYVTIGAGLRLSFGYNTIDGPQYANMGLFRVNRFKEQFKTDDLAIGLDCIDANWLLKNWEAQSALLIQSQNRLFLDFSVEGHDAYVVNINAAEWKLDENLGELVVSNVGQFDEVVGLVGEKFGGFVAEACFKTSTPNQGVAGIIFASTDDLLSRYTAVFDWSLQQITVERRVYTEGASSIAYIAVEPMTLKYGSYIWMKVMHHGGEIAVWTSTDGITWTQRLYETDPVGLAYGHVGVYGVLGTAGSLACRYLNVYSLNKDVTIDETIRAIATRAGILDFTTEQQVNDQFDTGSVDTDVWRTGEATIDNVAISSQTLAISMDDATLGFMNSQVTAYDIVADFSAKVGSGGYIQVIYRADAEFQNYYRVEIVAGTFGTCRVRWIASINGNETVLKVDYPYAVLPLDTTIDYRLSVDGQYVSLWAGGYLLLTGQDFRLLSEGYFGVGVYGTVPVYFDNIKSPYADAIIDSLAVNVGDKAEAICRDLALIAGCEYYIEGDAEMRLGSMITTSSQSDVFGSTDIITYEDQLEEAEVTKDDEDWATHVRTVGKGGVSVDYYDKSDAGLDALGYRFKVVNMNELASISALKEAARLEIEKRNRSITQRRLSGLVQLATERGDRIYVKIYNVQGYPETGYRVDDHFTVTSISYQLSKKPEPDFSMTLEVEAA